METLRTIWSDVKRTLAQTKDDLDIPDMQGWYWTLVVADRLRMQHIVKMRSGAYLTRFVLPVLTDTAFTSRYYVTLPRSIYDIDLDAAVECLCYWRPSACTPDYERITFFRSDFSRIRSRAMSKYQMPDPAHPYFLREGDRLYLEGVAAGLNNIEAHLYTTLPDVDSVDPDMPLDFPKELIYPLIRALRDMGRFALAMPGEHLTNDGTNRPAGRVAGAPEKTVSVYDPLVNTGDADK